MPAGQKRAPDLITNGCEPPCGCWELNSGPLEEQAVLLTSEPSLQPQKWYYNAAGFNKLGLMRDDTLHETADVKEAIRRLPEHLYNDRMFRIKRALDLSMQHQILPKEQWTKYEEDKFYLKPYLKEVIWERKEKEEWAKK
ncbi:cytochrome b-c1 complex subunit 7-like [Alexandromys fortis]|uniref:cytochrome b-c1 complex subunit 7-like n=1 Tax=Alexandromys fortis TaxID=100897 RepID=UPI0021535842|nr:cytochrome b-c1 complex subunit 7-like [Microtus fortis]